jgi:hypothetical protein
VTLDLGVGYGPTSYYFLIDDLGENDSNNQEKTSASSVGIGFAGVLGCRLQFAGPAAPINAFLDVQCHLQSISSIFEAEDDGTTVRIGATDVTVRPPTCLRRAS